MSYPAGVRGWIVGGVLLVGCGPSVSAETDGAGGSSGHAESDADSTGVTTMPGTTMPGTTMPTQGEADVDDGVDDESGVVDDGPSFTPVPDGGGTITGCSIWARDCPAGTKCMPYANDGGNEWNGTICVPLVEEPHDVGDPCTAFEGPLAGYDDCALHSMCWEVNPATNEGTCVAFCEGSEAEATCADPQTQCMQSADSVLALCLPTCHPLEDPCDGGWLCTWIGDDFTCVMDEIRRGANEGEECMYLDDCIAGLYCLAPSWLPGCDPDAIGCCSPFCDTTEEMPCAEGLECSPWYEEGTAPEGFESLGICGVQP